MSELLAASSIDPRRQRPLEVIDRGQLWKSKQAGMLTSNLPIGQCTHTNYAPKGQSKRRHVSDPTSVPHPGRCYSGYMCMAHPSSIANS